MLLEAAFNDRRWQKIGDFVDANGDRHRWPAVTGRNMIAALASFPPAKVQFDRLTIK